MSILEEQREAKRAIAEGYREVADIADQIGMKTLATEVRTRRLPKLESERFHLVVLGEFNHGKSTFVNALLGASVLPTGITPTTAAINHVQWSPSPSAAAILIDGGRIDLLAEDLREWVTVAGEHSSKVAHVEVGFPAELLRDGVVLVDTPGVNDLNEQRADVTYGYVPRADAVIFLLDAGQALKDSEREFLSSHVLEGTRDRLIFVLGKIDLLTEGERGAVVDYVKKGLAKLVPDPVVFPVSARRYLEGGRDGSGFEPLLDHLGRFLAADRARVLLDNAAADAARTASYVGQNVGVKVHAYDLGLVELEERVAEVRRKLDSSKRKLDELHGMIKGECHAIKSQVRLDLDAFARAFVAVLPDQIDAVDADDVKTYLASFVEEKFREWAELEGAKVASQLESLAERVIAVTNENVAEASAALGSRLGRADTAVDIEVDSFKYDVGVYAIGALGTTVFLFINTLAGGLLTLAAPILAIVLKSKVAGDIRQQAKERVPAAVLRAADAMAPHFAATIDGFGERLSAFVTAAGNTLYRGISEVLDQTVEEKRQGESALAPRRAEVAALGGRTAEIVAALGRLRGELWREPPTEAAPPG
jgi:GTP-binding protein EngB required for normal cell division